MPTRPSAAERRGTALFRFGARPRARWIVAVIVHLVMLAAVVALWDTSTPRFIYDAF